MTPDRKTVTSLLTKAVIGYLVKSTHGVNTEFGVIPWGRRKVDVIGMSFKGRITIVEVKSCKADLKADDKFHEYLPFCHRMYLAVDHRFYNRERRYILSRLPEGVGLMVLQERSGWMKVVRPATIREMEDDTYQTILRRLAFRNAKFSKRNTRRTRVFLPQTTEI